MDIGSALRSSGAIGWSGEILGSQGQGLGEAERFPPYPRQSPTILLYLMGW